MLNPDKGYNKDPGGFQNKNMYKDCVIRKIQKPVNKYDLEGNFICGYSSLVEASIKNNCSSVDISLCCSKKSNVKTVKGFVYRYADTLESSGEIKQYINNHGANVCITQYTKDGIKIKEYQSIKEASLITGINAGNISFCCLGKIKKLKGFIWKKSDELLTEEEIFARNQRNAHYNKIQQFSLEGQLIKIYDNAKIAGEYTGIDSSSIIKCCKHKANTAGGYKWEYLIEEE